MIHFLVLIVIGQLSAAISSLFFRLSEEKHDSVFLNVGKVTSLAISITSTVLLLFTLFSHKQIVTRKEIDKTSTTYELDLTCLNERKACAYKIDMDDGMTHFRYIDGGKIMTTSVPTDATKTFQGNMNGKPFVNIVNTAYYTEKAWKMFYVSEINNVDTYEFYIPQSFATD